LLRLISPYFPDRELHRYLKHQRCSPEPGMRRAVKAPGGFVCWLYDHFEWQIRSVTDDRHEAVSWWLGDPWLPSPRSDDTAE